MRISLMNGNWEDIETNISKTLAFEVRIKDRTPISGGCINQSWKITDAQNRSWFIKTNSKSQLDMFIAEAEGLNEIANSNSIRSPKTICYGITNTNSYLVLEHIDLQPLSKPANAGRQLAEMHQYTNKRFGWVRDNTIGTTTQSNKKHKDWISFWQKERLLFQLNLAKNNGYSSKAYDEGLKLSQSLPNFFSSYTPEASLLHGDLWGGNCASNKKGETIIFDPAVYYGDREADIAMTELFGGFSADFYAAYNETNPLDQGYKTRKALYNLYHILNHFNLFGSGYQSQAVAMTQKLLSELN